MEKAKLFLELSKEETDSVSRLTFPPHRAHVDYSFYEYYALRGVRVDRVEPGLVSCTFRVPHRLLDRNGNLASGAVANLVDEMGGALVHVEGLPMNVSVDMSISYLSTAKLDFLIISLGVSFIASIGIVFLSSVIHSLDHNMLLKSFVNSNMDDELEIVSKFLGRKGSFSGTLVLVRNKTSGELIAEGRHSLFGKHASKM